MTVEQLIRELRAMPPQLAVRVVVGNITRGDEQGEYETPLNETDATEAEDVLHRGAYVLIQGR